jgi:hypothetical protein
MDRAGIRAFHTMFIPAGSFQMLAEHNEAVAAL